MRLRGSFTMRLRLVFPTEFDRFRDPFFRTTASLSLSLSVTYHQLLCANNGGLIQ